MTPSTRVDVESLVRKDVAALAEYAPVEPIEALATTLGLPLERIAKLDDNHNPYGPSPAVARALVEADLSLYPDPFHTDVRAAIAPFAGVDPERILFGNGSDELLELIIRLTLDPGDSVIDCVPTFGMYAFLPPLFQGRVKSVKRREDFSVDVNAVEQAIDGRTKLILVAAPNNPSGTPLPEGDVRRLLETGRIVVLDEAYVEFSGDGRSYTSATALSESYDNLVVLRTFSKWAGLAGVRAGWGVFPPSLIKHLWKIKQPYNLSVCASTAVIASLKDRDYLMGNVQKIVEERSRLFEVLRTRAAVVYPSAANFILARFPDAPAVKDRLLRQGLVVRSYFSSAGLEDCLRFTVGLPEHTARLAEALA